MEQAVSRPASVLVVEDEALILEMMSEVLAESGFQVHAFSNARDALRYLSEGPVDVLFTDINLPGEMDGTALAMLARQMRPELPVVYASGGMSARDLQAVPGSAFVPKPYDPEQICAILGRMAAAH
jgi:CheY-like chemotaxis protein